MKSKLVQLLEAAGEHFWFMMLFVWGFIVGRSSIQDGETTSLIMFFVFFGILGFCLIGRLFFMDKKQ